MSEPIPIPVQDAAHENPRTMLSRQLSRSSELPRMSSTVSNPFTPSTPSTPTTAPLREGSRVSAKPTRTEGSTLKSRAKKRRKSESVAFASLRSALSPRKSKKSLFSPDTDISTSAIDVEFIPQRPRAKFFSCYFPADRDAKLKAFIESHQEYESKKLPSLPHTPSTPKPRRDSSGSLQRLTPQTPQTLRSRSGSKSRRSPREGEREKIERKTRTLLQLIQTERIAPVCEEQSPSYEELAQKVKEQEETIAAMQQSNQEAKFGEIVKLRTQLETLKTVHSSTLDRVELLKQALSKVKQEYEKSQVVVRQLNDQLAERNPDSK